MVHERRVVGEREKGSQNIRIEIKNFLMENNQKLKMAVKGRSEGISGNMNQEISLW